MEFTSTSDFDSEAEGIVWNALKEAFKEEPGYCWHRYPITSYRGPRLEPDIIMLHPDFGLNVIEVKGCSIENIESIEGYTWYMQDWYEDEIEPHEQAQKHMWAILDRIKNFKHGFLRDEKGNCKINGRAFIGLPFINEQEWRKKFQDHLSAPKWELICSTHLQPEALYQKIAHAPIQKRYPLVEDSEEWQAALAVLMNSEGIQVKKRRPTKKQDSKLALLRKVDDKIKAFDLQQHRVAVQTPSGPQRIRGLAGTGKTVVLAQKAAYMHVEHPEWKIVFTFYSRSLYDQIINYITRFVQELSQGELEKPDWNQVRVLHAWGSADQSGFYREIAEIMDEPFRNFQAAKSYFGTSSGHVAFDSCCGELLGSFSEIPELFDAILIDEAQDFGENYFRLCYSTLKQPKRIIWGYDEVQSLEELEIPTAESLFGKDVDGNPLVNLDGLYPGEIEKDMILYHCYRNPRPILIAAHAFGLGLKRKGGAVQFIDTVAGWRDIGYEVEGASGNKLITGEQVSLHRPSSNSSHLLEQIAGYHNLVSCKLFQSREQELQWIIDDIARNIEHEELRPDDIVVIALDSRPKVASEEYQTLYSGLEQKNIQSVRIGIDSSVDVFRTEGAVTITSVFRAKGNEASLVYVYGFEDVGKLGDIVRRRNKAFTAMTRTKGWLVLSGVGSIAQELFREIEAILEEIGRVNFIVPDVNKIQRNLETYENQRRRKRTQKAQKSLTQLLIDRADVNPDDLPLEQRKKLLKWLLGEGKDIDNLLTNGDDF
jgi:superfamily I DNA and RNA helicase